MELWKEVSRNGWTIESHISCRLSKGCSQVRSGCLALMSLMITIRNIMISSQSDTCIDNQFWQRISVCVLGVLHANTSSEAFDASKQQFVSWSLGPRHVHVLIVSTRYLEPKSKSPFYMSCWDSPHVVLKAMWNFHQMQAVWETCRSVGHLPTFL